MGNPTIGTHPFPKGYYHVASTLLTLLSEILKFSKIVICKEQDSGKENIESSRIFY